MKKLINRLVSALMATLTLLVIIPEFKVFANTEKSSSNKNGQEVTKDIKLPDNAKKMKKSDIVKLVIEADEVIFTSPFTAEYKSSTKAVAGDVKWLEKNGKNLMDIQNNKVYAISEQYDKKANTVLKEEYLIIGKEGYSRSDGNSNWDYMGSNEEISENIKDRRVYFSYFDKDDELMSFYEDESGYYVVSNGKMESYDLFDIFPKYNLVFSVEVDYGEINDFIFHFDKEYKLKEAYLSTGKKYGNEEFEIIQSSKVDFKVDEKIFKDLEEEVKKVEKR